VKRNRGIPDRSVWPRTRSGNGNVVGTGRLPRKRRDDAINKRGRESSHGQIICPNICCERTRVSVNRRIDEPVDGGLCDRRGQSFKCGPQIDQQPKTRTRFCVGLDVFPATVAEEMWLLRSKTCVSRLKSQHRLHSGGHLVVAAWAHINVFVTVAVGESRGATKRSYEMSAVAGLSPSWS